VPVVLIAPGLALLDALSETLFRHMDVSDDVVPLCIAVTTLNTLDCPLPKTLNLPPECLIDSSLAMPHALPASVALSESAK
jgi:hypothetical protein